MLCEFGLKMAIQAHFEIDFRVDMGKLKLFLFYPSRNELTETDILLITQCK